jgi:hypothetical protein
MSLADEFFDKIAGIKCLDPKIDPCKVDELQNIFAELLGKAVPDVKHVGNAPPENEDVPEAKLFKDIIDGGGKLNKRSTTGNQLYAELKKNPELKAEKDKYGNTREGTNTFVRNWAQRKFNEITITKTKTDTMRDLETLDAEYCTFGRIVQREGKDADAFEIAKNWCVGALQAWEQNTTFHGHPYIKYSEWRKKVLILHTRERISHSFCQDKSMSISESGAMKRSALDDSMDLPATVCLDAPGTETVQKKSRPGSVGADSGGKAGKEKTMTNAAALSALKGPHDKAVQGAKDLLATVENDEEWAWCRHSSLLEPLQKILSDIGVIKKSSELWKAWTLSSNFVMHCQKHADPKDVETQYDKDFGNMKGFIKQAETLTKKLKNMQAANCV